LEPEKEKPDALLSIPDASQYLDMGVVVDVNMDEDDRDSSGERHVPDLDVRLVLILD
jgi:hypothetical protein